jgi:hypothetical protein
VIPLSESHRAQEENFIFYIVDYLEEVKSIPNQIDYNTTEKTVKIPVDIREGKIVSFLPMR